MSFQSTIYSTPSFQVIPAQRNFTAPWGVVSHLPKTIALGSDDMILTPEQTVSGTFLVTLILHFSFI